MTVKHVEKLLRSALASTRRWATGAGAATEEEVTVDRIGGCTTVERSKIRLRSHRLLFIRC